MKFKPIEHGQFRFAGVHAVTGVVIGCDEADALPPTAEALSVAEWAERHRYRDDERPTTLGAVIGYDCEVRTSAGIIRPGEDQAPAPRVTDEHWAAFDRATKEAARAASAFGKAFAQNVSKRMWGWFVDAATPRARNVLSGVAAIATAKDARGRLPMRDRPLSECPPHPREETDYAKTAAHVAAMDRVREEAERARLSRVDEWDLLPDADPDPDGIVPGAGGR